MLLRGVTPFSKSVYGVRHRLSLLPLRVPVSTDHARPGDPLGCPHGAAGFGPGTFVRPQ